MYSYVMLYIYIYVVTHLYSYIYIYVLFFHGNVNVPGEFSSLDMEVDIVEIAHQLMPFGWFTLWQTYMAMENHNF